MDKNEAKGSAVKSTDAANMQSDLESDQQTSQEWPVDLKLTHLDWNPEADLIHFQGQYLTLCELDYNILHREIQTVKKTNSALDIGEFCLVEDSNSACWHRGRVQRRQEDLFDVFLIDRGNVLSVHVTHISSCAEDLFMLPPKIVCGFLSNVLLLQGCSHSVLDDYFSSLIGKYVTGYIQAILPHKVLLLEVPDINWDLVRHGFGRHLDTDTFLLLVEILTEVPLKQSVHSVPDLLIEKPRGQEFSSKPSGLQIYKEILSFFRPRLECGTRVKVRVTAAVSPGLFYCQMASVEANLKEMSNKLAALCERRTEECSQKAETENLGLLCSVKGKDGTWHRGFVQLLPVNSQVRVLFIDYGFFESVEIDNVHRLPSGFYTTPIMVFPCSLTSFIGDDETIRTQQLGFLKAALLGGVLGVEIKGFDEGQHLYSISVIGVEDNHVNEPESVREHPEMKNGPIPETEESSTQGRYLYHETIMSKTLDETLEAEELQVGSTFVGYVEYVQNPNRFWIRTQKRNAEFKDMMGKIADHFSQVKLDEDVLSNPELGAMCCAVYEKDMHFYRGVVTDTLDHGAEVLFVDFGNVEKVPHMLIKKMPEEFARKSAFAFCCSLFNVFPLGDLWTCAVSTFFKRAVSNKALLVRVVHRKKNKFVVDLYEEGSGNSQSIAELLVSSKQAEYWNSPMECEVPNNADVSRSTRFPTYNVTPEIKKNAEEREKDNNTCHNETESSPTAGLKALNITPGCEFAVRCSYIKSPSDFWCQPLEKVPALGELMNKLQQFYTSHTVPLQSGDLRCIAKSPVDGAWHRALITEKQKGQARVMLIDSGLNVRISEDGLQGMMPEFVCLEGQAFRCSLCSLIEPVDLKSCGEWGSEACKSLKDFVLDATGGLRCKVVSQLNVKNKGLCNMVDLYNSQSQQSITNVLMELGLAREAPSPTQQLSTAFPDSFVYSSYGVRPGSEEQVYVTHVSSQWEVFCQLERSSELIEKLEITISEEIGKMMQPSTRAVVGKLCLAKYFDGNWYRGLAQAVKSPQHLSVFFVDYGNTNLLERTQVVFIPRDSADLLYTPMQALRCSLASVSKQELYADVKDWLDGAILNKQVRAVVLGKNEDGSLDVELFDGDVEVNEKVKELIVSQLPKPKAYVSSDRCFSRSKVRVQTSPDHTRETDVPQLAVVPDRQLDAGFRAKCFVSHVDSVRSFFLQLSEDQPDLLKMVEDLNSGFLRGSLQIAAPLRIGDLVVAEYEDGAVYRAAVKNYEGTSHYVVEFIDYGNAAAVGKEKIYSVPKTFLSQPRFSVLCSLLDTSPFKNEASFTDAVIDKPVVVDFVRRHGTRWEVAVETPEGNDSLPAPHEAAVLEKRPATGTEAAPPATPPEIEATCKNETTKPKTTKPAVQSKNYVPKPSPGTRSTKLRVKTCRGRKTTRASIKRGSKDNLKESSKSSTKVLSGCSDAVPTVLAKDAEICTVLSVQSNGTFYIRLANTTDMFAALEAHIADNLNKSETVLEEDVRRGLDCLAEVGDKWHRATVQQTGHGKCQVLLVDHGITEEISSGSLRKQWSGLNKIPNLAVLCKMNGEGETVKSWEHVFESATGKEVTVVFVHRSEAQQLWMVERVLGHQEQSQGAMSLPPESQHEATEVNPPQQLDFAPVDMNKSYFGFAAAITTPFEFCVVLEHSLPTMNKDPANLKRLPLDLIKLPKVTYPCILRGVQPVGADEQWTDEAADFFQQTLGQRNLQIFFREFVSDTHWKVDVLADGVHVAKELVDAGHATYLDSILGLRFQVRSPQTACLQDLDSEEDEGSDGESDVPAVEAERKMLLDATSPSPQCLLAVQPFP